MNCTGVNALGHLGSADDGSTIVKTFDQILFFDLPFLGILWIYPHNPVIITVDKDPVVFDIIYITVLPVKHGMKAEPGMGGYELEGVFFIEFRGMMPLPGRHIFGYGRPLRVVRVKPLQA